VLESGLQFALEFLSVIVLADARAGKSDMKTGAQ
jgi:hypothetical protein